MTGQFIPVCISHCAECGVGTHTIGEWYMVHNNLWEQAWAGRRKAFHGKIPGQEILCIGCLEKRLGRTLTRTDFKDCPVNTDSSGHRSDRLRMRLQNCVPASVEREALRQSWRKIRGTA
jgi:hypothetical protein